MHARDYFVGDGTWESMSSGRREAFAALLPPNFHEWDCVMNETTTIEELAGIAADVLVVRFGGTRRALSEIFDLFVDACPHWAFEETAEGGHMAPLTSPHLIGPIVTKFLSS